MAQYGFETTAEDIARGVNLTGKNVIVTGGYTGIGRETSRVFALSGAHVFVVGRDTAKATKAVDELKAETKKQNITPMEMDLASLSSVRDFAKKFNDLKIPLHYLILNAGVMACPYGKTKDGFEIQFGTNFVGHFLLSHLLVPRLTEGAPSRVVSVSSSGNYMGSIQFDDFNFEKTPYNEWVAYGQSKTANILFAIEFNRRYKAQGITANAVHPGRVPTELGRHMTAPIPLSEYQKIPGFKEMLLAYKTGMTPKTPGQGASSTLYAALSEDTKEGGKFYYDCQEAPAAPYAKDPEIAKKLWVAAEKMVGVN